MGRVWNLQILDVRNLWQEPPDYQTTSSTVQRPTGWPQTDKRMSPTWRAPHLRREKLNLVNHLESRILLCLDCIDKEHRCLDIIDQEYRFQDHIESKISLCLDNVNYDHLSLVVFHHRDRNWPVSKARLLQALNDDRLCVRTSEKDSLIISIFSNLFF